MWKFERSLKKKFLIQETKGAGGGDTTRDLSFLKPIQLNLLWKYAIWNFLPAPAKAPVGNNKALFKEQSIGLVLLCLAQRRPYMPGFNGKK